MYKRTLWTKNFSRLFVSKFKKGYIETIQKKFTQSARDNSLSKYETYITRAINRRSQLVVALLTFQAETHFLYVFHKVTWTLKSWFE